MPACSLAVPKIFFSHSHSQKLPAGTPTAWEPGYQDTDFLEPGVVRESGPVGGDGPRVARVVDAVSLRQLPVGGAQEHVASS